MRLHHVRAVETVPAPDPLDTVAILVPLVADVMLFIVPEPSACTPSAAYRAPVTACALPRRLRPPPGTPGRACSPVG